MSRIALFACLLVAAWQPESIAEPEPASPTTSITYCEFGLPRTLDPHRASDVDSFRHAMHVYETLLEYAPFGQALLQPCLASEMPDYDREKFTYTFHLRDDIYFADDDCFPDGKGRKVTAADIVFSFKRLAAVPDSAGYWVLEGQIAGLDDFRARALDFTKFVPHEDTPDEYILAEGWWKHLDSEVEGLTAVDERTVRFALNQAYPQFLHAITLPYGAVVAREAASKHNLSTHPVGTGPYTLETMSEIEIVYKRNTRYREVTLADVPKGSLLKPFEGKKLPLTDELRYEIALEDTGEFDGFMEKRYPVSGVDKNQITKVIDVDALKAGKTGDNLLNSEFGKLGLRLIDNAEPTLHYIAFNMSDPAFGTPAGDKGRALRRAFAMCIDRRDYIDRHMNGRGFPAHQMLPAGVPGHDKACALASQTCDPVTARKILVDAGFSVKPDGDGWITMDGDSQVELVVCFRSTSETMKLYAGWLTESALQVGIKMKAELLTFAEFLERQNEGAGQAFDAGWVMDYPDAQNLLQLLYGPYKPPGINSAAYNSSEYNKLYEEMAGLRDEVPEEAARKKKLIVKMHEVFEQDAPWVLMDFRRTFSLQWSGYATTPPNPFAYGECKYAFLTK
jgi:oligopeptide transport system substrate-binding protein